VRLNRQKSLQYQAIARIDLRIHALRDRA